MLFNICSEIIVKRFENIKKCNNSKKVFRSDEVTKQRIPKHDVNVFEYLLKGMYVHEIIILFFGQSFFCFINDIKYPDTTI